MLHTLLGVLNAYIKEDKENYLNVGTDYFGLEH
jgi:hypothetical protein